MGVPALFRWLSKKYPKIISPVVEEESVKVGNGSDETMSIPMNFAQPNPNGEEFDNLYLDMNGIVHPCTHPEGKPAPETEEEMMLAVFEYTERVVNMVRPRKVLVMAIDGVAPRAKMNQQRSRRFRAAQEASEREQAQAESQQLWSAMGKQITEPYQKGWDTNAITPGTPFMDLLAASLRYWVAAKMNADAGWKDLQVIISDSSVPGEGEHKIMDFIRRMRTVPGYDPNTKHVIYGLDADLIMLSLATHEPNFKVLREDVFATDNVSSTACRNCGEEGHYSARCTNAKKQVQPAAKPAKMPFIFLDVAVLREYLEVELDVPHAPFPYDFERALDDWILLIFFVGNDFLPHLPSLEIREGAIDTLLKIWKTELPRMGGYVTEHGHLVLDRVQIILEGLASREDDIFRRRRETEQRQNQSSKRRKLEREQIASGDAAGPAAALGLSMPPLTGANPLHPSLPARPDFAAVADQLGFGAQPPTAAQAWAGSNHDVVANRRAIRMANMSAAEMLKAEMAGQSPEDSGDAPAEPVPTLNDTRMEQHSSVPAVSTPPNEPDAASLLPSEGADTAMASIASADDSVAGSKRSFDEGPGAPEEEQDQRIEGEDDDDAPPDLIFKKNADGTVEQEDTVKYENLDPQELYDLIWCHSPGYLRLWEPGYRERYYRQKFGIQVAAGTRTSDHKKVQKIVKSYVEGMAWVLHYYYHGTPSWQWYYPYHFAPFANDFVDIAKLNLAFELGEPFHPFEQLMAVFPAASKSHLPASFHWLMTDANSPIIDFYPLEFQIDMNGKKMAWQGVALLPFIDERRLLDAMAPINTKLSEEDALRNTRGIEVVFASRDHPIYPFYEQLYGKRKNNDPSVIAYAESNGLGGSVLPNPGCIPGSTYDSPLNSRPDIPKDTSLSVNYIFPPQATPHRSVLLPGAKRPPRQLTAEDLANARHGGRPRGGFDNRNTGRSVYDRPPGRGSQYGGQGQGGYGQQHGGYSNRGGRQPYPPRDNGGRYDRPSNDYGGYGRQPPGPNPSGYGPQQHSQGGYGGRYNGPQSYNGGGYQNSRDYNRPSGNYGGYGGNPGGGAQGPARGGSGRGRGGPQGGNYGQPNNGYGGYGNQPGYGQRQW